MQAGLCFGFCIQARPGSCVEANILIDFLVTVRPHPQLVPIPITFTRDGDIGYHVAIQ